MTEQTNSVAKYQIYEDTLAQPDAILARFADGPSLLESAIADFAEKDLDLALNPDEFTIRQYIHHVVDSDRGFSECIKAALGNSEGLFSIQWYFDKTQVSWATSWRSSNRDLEPSLDLFKANRRYMVHLLEQIPDAWERSIRWQWAHHVADNSYQRNMPIGQEERMTVGRMLEIQAGHVAHHIDDIYAIRRAHNR